MSNIVLKTQDGSEVAIDKNNVNNVVDRLQRYNQNGDDIFIIWDAEQRIQSLKVRNLKLLETFFKYHKKKECPAKILTFLFEHHRNIFDALKYCNDISSYNTERSMFDAILDVYGVPTYVRPYMNISRFVKDFQYQGDDISWKYICGKYYVIVEGRF